MRRRRRRRGISGKQRRKRRKSLEEADDGCRVDPEVPRRQISRDGITFKYMFSCMAVEKTFRA